MLLAVLLPLLVLPALLGFSRFEQRMMGSTAARAGAVGDARPDAGDPA